MLTPTVEKLFIFLRMVITKRLKTAPAALYAKVITLPNKRATINTPAVPRETPLRTVHLENMTKLSGEGAIILPAMPGFYHKPQTLDDQINFIVGKILDIMDIDNNLFTKWKQ